MQLVVRAEIGEGYSSPAVDGRRLPAARRGRQGRGQSRRRAGAHAAHRRGSVGAPVRGDDQRRSRRIRAAHHCHRRQPRRQRGAEGRGAPPWCGQPEDERPRRWRACVHDGTASTDRHFHGGVRQPARIRRSLRRIGGQHDGQVRGGASARRPGAAGRGWTRSARRRRSRDFLARRVGPAASSRTIRFACNRHWQGVPGERFGLAGVYAGHRFRDSGEPGSSEEIFLPVADERLTALFAPTSEPAAGGDERGGMEQRVNALVANRQLGAARELLEQWAAKWPDDVRVAKPLALLYATSGRAVESVRLLQRHIAAYPDDVDALGLGVEWLYRPSCGRRLNLVDRGRSGPRAPLRRQLH